MRALTRSLLAFALVCLGCRPAIGAVYALAPDALIALAPHVSPGDRLESDFSILIWIRPDAESTAASSIFEIPGVLTLGTSPSGSLTAALQVEDMAGDPHALVVDSGHRLLGQQWQLVAVSFRRAGYFDLFHADSTGTYSNVVNIGFEVAPNTTDAGGPRLGLGSDGTPAMVGAYGLLACRSHPVKAPDITALRATRRYFALYDHEAASGSMNGVDGAEWMLDHAITTLPVDIDAGGTKRERAAVIGQLAGVHNIHVYDKRDVVGEESERFNLVRQATEVHGFRYMSTREPPLDGWFIVDPGLFAFVYPSVPGESSLAAQLASHPRRPIRMFVSANSRAVFRDEGTGESPGNYAHGFIDLKRPEIAGVLFRPAARGGEGPWFGLDCTDPPREVNSELIDSAVGDHASFSRFWTGSARATAKGPGGGLFLRQWGYFEMRCKPEPGSLVTADAPLVVEAHVMAFPGASPLLWKPRRGAWQSEVGVDDAAVQGVDMDTTRHIHTYGSDDRILNNTAIVLKGNFDGLVVPGDAMYIASGSAAGQINVVATVTQGITQATITFDMPMLQSPEPDSEIHFGPWHFETIRHEFGPVPEGDSRNWRGIFVQATGEGFGFPVFGYSAFRPNADGFLVGVAGWGGHGYLQQIIDSEPSALVEWMRRADPDLWIQVPAQQNAVPSNMSDYTAAIRAAKPDCEIVWAVEAEHPGYIPSGWAEYVRDHAADEGVVGIVALNRLGIGTALEQLGDGHRINIPHINQRGNLLLANVWCELLESAAIDPCPADFAPPWHVYDFFDVQRFLTAFVTDNPTADLTGDGVIDFFDVQRFLNDFTSGCN